MILSDAERRRRLAARHALVTPADSPEAATRAMVVLHATEPATVYLSLWARIADVTVADVDRDLYEDRTLAKQLAMRRTLFVFPRDLLPAAWGSAAARVAGQQSPRLVKEAESIGEVDGEEWLHRAARDVVALLADGTPRTAQQIRAEVPALDLRLVYGEGKSYGGSTAMGPRVLTLLGAQAEIMRGRNTGHWRTSRPEWALTRHWLGDPPEPVSAAAGYAELVRRWLERFGPGTEDDIVWWLGATRGAVRTALRDVEAEPVQLESGRPAWILPDDRDETPDPEPWAALLPVLDPTVMGWKGRDFYLGPHGAELFDRNGNAGTTAWWDGRIVGCWVQDPAGVVHLHLLEDVPEAGRAALAARAVQLTEWLDGTVIGTVYPSPAMRRAREALQPGS